MTGAFVSEVHFANAPYKPVLFGRTRPLKSVKDVHPAKAKEIELTVAGI